jgi:hypothetical protein
MSCPIHDRCTCCSTSLQYAAAITTTTGSSQFFPQSSNILFGYEWAPPLVATPGGAWHTVDPVTLHPSSTSYPGLDLPQPDCYRPRNTYETMPSHHTYHREPLAHPYEQKKALPSREQVSVVIVNVSSQTYTDQFVTQPPYPAPYIQGVGRMGMPSSFSGATLPALNLHCGGNSSFVSHEDLSQTEPAFVSDQSLFDEPPPPYTNNSQVVHSLGNAFPPSAVFSADRLLNLGPIPSSPLAPVPLRHSSLYQVLKHESPASPLTGTRRSRVSSLAHALEPQEPQARQAPLPCTPALGDRLGSYGILAPSPNATQMTSTSLTRAEDPRSTLVQVPLQLQAAPGPEQVQALVTSETRSTTCANAPGLNLSVVTPLHAHTLGHSFPEIATHDYDTQRRLRKVSLKTAFPTHAVTHPLTEALLSGAAPTSAARTRQGGSFYCV